VLAAEQAGLSGKFALAGLAKEDELLFVPGREAPIALPRNSPGLYLLQRVRDEAHRFAITAHRAQRGKRALVSALDAVEGIGPKRRKALLKAFGSVDGVKEASLEALTGVPGVTRELAERIKRDLL
jgi:excinuclease ABC subunit C